MGFQDDMMDDLDDFMDSDVFAISAIFSGTEDINVIFDNESEPILDISTGGVMTGKPQAIAKTSDVPDAKGKTLKVNGTTYNIIESRPDGTGMTTLKLSKD